MKSMTMSRQSVYLLIITIFLLIFVFLFAFFVLIPSGQQYRVARNMANKSEAEFAQYQQQHDDTLAQLKSLQSKHKNVVNAFSNSFNKVNFIVENKKYFQNLTLTKVAKVDRQSPFDLYEVNATSKISSPEVFYNFLDSLNKNNWIIGVNFPIHFKKEGEFIVSSFTMRVYNLNEDAKETKSVKKAIVKEQNSTVAAPLKVELNATKN